MSWLYEVSLKYTCRLKLLFLELLTDRKDIKRPEPPTNNTTPTTSGSSPHSPERLEETIKYYVMIKQSTNINLKALEQEYFLRGS
jgi:hypothetical protein